VGGDHGATGGRDRRRQSATLRQVNWKIALLFGALLAASCSDQATTSASSAATAAPSPAGTAAASPAAAAAGAGAADPVSAVRALFTSPGPCLPPSGAPYSAVTGCPVTARLGQRLGTNPAASIGGGGDPICRCQNHPEPVPVTLVSQGSSSAVVKADLSFPGLPYMVQFVVVSVGGRWFVDDSYCADLSTSIYATTPVKPCTT
jgi:hypothetical protein